MSKKQKLHELLAIITDCEATAKAIRDEAKTTFTKRTHHFRGSHKTLKMLDDARAAEEAGAEAHENLVTTVSDKLQYVSESHVKWLDTCLQIEKTNQEAKASLVLDGIEFGTDLPVTFLLGLESKLKQLRAVIFAVPTLDPTIEWISDPEKGDNIYRSKHPILRQRTEKQRRHDIMVPSTKEHPAQVSQWQEDVVIGTFTQINWSGMITPGQKSDMLERVDNLIRATKQARQRANSTEVEDASIGKKLFDYILDKS